MRITTTFPVKNVNSSRVIYGNTEKRKLYKALFSSSEQRLKLFDITFYIFLE
jgi:hypothetical protein